VVSILCLFPILFNMCVYFSVIACAKGFKLILLNRLLWFQVVSAQDAGGQIGGGGGGQHSNNLNSNNSIYCSSINSPDSMGRRRKKRTSIESTVRIALERAFSQGQRPKPGNWGLRDGLNGRNFLRKKVGARNE
jgi:hypothetical protein